MVSRRVSACRVVSLSNHGTLFGNTSFDSGPEAPAQDEDDNAPLTTPYSLHAIRYSLFAHLKKETYYDQNPRERTYRRTHDRDG